MKLIRFSQGDSKPRFGVVITDHAVAFTTLLARRGVNRPELSDSPVYLAGLPASEAAARELAAWGGTHLAEWPEGERPRRQEVRLHAPIEVAALFDFGLTPRHLRNSAETLMKYEKDDPQTAANLQAFAKALLTPPESPPPGVPERLSYYKCNMNSITGDGETIPWPLYTSRLDIEPELAVVYGNPRQPVAGFCIFNDVSARDVQATEFVGGFCLTKDMANGNQLGPYLVTPDEVGDPYNLAVTVVVNGEVKYRGSTSEISHTADAVFAWLGFIAPIKPGTVAGFGTIPDCTGCDQPSPTARGVITTTSSIRAPTSRSPSNVSARSAADSPSRPARCCRVAGRFASRC